MTTLKLKRPIGSTRKLDSITAVLHNMAARKRARKFRRLIHVAPADDVLTGAGPMVDYIKVTYR